MKKLYHLFVSIPFFGYRYLALTVVLCLLAMAWSGVCCLLHEDKLGRLLSYFGLMLSPAVLFFDFHASFLSGIANMYVRRPLKFLSALASLLLLVEGGWPVCEWLLAINEWDDFIAQLSARTLVVTMTIPMAMTIGIPQFYYHVSKLSDFRFWRKRQKGKGGSAKWASVGTYFDKAPRFKKGDGKMTPDLRLGSTRFIDDPRIRDVAIRDKSHVLAMASTGSGKGSTFLNSLHATALASMISNDPKGEFARMTYHRRNSTLGRYQGKAFMLDPFGVNNGTGIPSAKYNLLSEISLEDPDFELYVRAIADGCVIVEPNDKPHFIEIAKDIISGLIVLVIAKYPKKDHSLPFALDLLVGVEQIDEETSAVDPENFQRVVQQMLECSEAGGLAMRAGNVLKRVGPNELGSIISTVTRSLSWIGTVQIREHISGESDLKLRSIGVDGFHTTVYIVFPFSRTDSHSRWMRCIFNLATTLLKTRHERPKDSIILCLDEFSTIGALSSIKQDLAVLRSYGIRLVTVIQNVAQIRTHFGEEWTTFAANSTIVAFGIHDLQSAKWISDSLGRHIHKNTSRELMSPAELMTDLSKESNRMVVLPSTATKGRDNLPMMLERRSYIHYTVAFRQYNNERHFYRNLKG